MRICGVYVCRVAFQLTAENNTHTHTRSVVGVSVCAVCTTQSKAV